MKLLIILSIEEYADEVRHILADQRISVFSETEIRGCQCDSRNEKADLSNWLADVDTMVYSHLFFTFNDQKSAEKVLSVVDHYNQMYGKDLSNPLHVYLLDVEKYV